MSTLPPIPRISAGILLRILIVLCLLSLLLSGLWTGLLRIGWILPNFQHSLAGLHGPLLACGLLGTLICLERAVALGQPIAFLSPVLSLAGGIVLLLGVAPSLAALLISSASIGLLLIFAALLKRQPARFVITMALGTLAWLGGNLLWLGARPFALVGLWWAGFLVMTIVGERLELGRLRQLPGRAMWLFTMTISLLLLGLVVALINLDLGIRLAGTSFIGLGLWLLRYDIARRTIRKAAVPRFSAICILSGSVWLIIGGVIGLIEGAVYAGPLYDALLHTIFVGFVFAMIFGHAPIIAPALLKLPQAFSAWSYAPLLLLHAALLLRLSGDLLQMADLRRWGGMLNAISIVLYLLILIATNLKAIRTAPKLQIASSGLHDPGW